MSIQQGHVYSGVQAIPSLAEENKVDGVLSTGAVDNKTATVQVAFAINFGLESEEEQNLRKTRSVFWQSTRMHLTGLHEYFLQVPAELATLCGFRAEKLAVIESAITVQSAGRTIKSYFLRPYNPNRRGIQPGTHRAIKLWTCVQDVGQTLIRYPEMQDALSDLTLDHRLNAIYSKITDEDYL